MIYLSSNHYYLGDAMKNTKQRKIVLDIVNNSDSHLDAFGVYKLARMSIVWGLFIVI